MLCKLSKYEPPPFDLYASSSMYFTMLVLKEYTLKINVGDGSIFDDTRE